jgi:hypothetical protein
MKKFLLGLITVLMFTGITFGQLNGTYNIPGSYPTLADAITDLNTVGVSGNVTLNLLAGNPQTAPAGGYVIGSATLSGAGANSSGISQTVTITGNSNTITAYAPQVTGALNDGIFKILGADYITIQGFTMQENAANTITTAASNDMTEWGVAVLYFSVTDGAKNITVQNNIITLVRTYQNTFGIYSNVRHSPTAISTAADITNVSGATDNLKIYNNNISNINNGIVVVGSTTGAYMNTGIDVGGSAAGTANTISNYGTTGTFSGYISVSGSVMGINVNNGLNVNISYNSITCPGLNTAGTVYGIYYQASGTLPTTGGPFTNTLIHNTLSVKSGLTSGTIYGLYNTVGNSLITYDVSYNDFNNFGHTGSGTGTIYVLYCSGAGNAQTINYNTFTNLSVNTTGSVYLLHHGSSLPLATSTQTVTYNSIVTGFTKTGAGGTVYCTYTNSASVASSSKIHAYNNFSNITLTGATILMSFQETDGGSPNKSIHDNILSNVTGGTSAITGLNYNYGTANIYSNTFTNIAGGGAITVMSCGGASATLQNVYSNTISGISSTGASAIYGIQSLASGTSAISNVYKNKVYDITGSNASSIIYGIYVSAGTTINTYNNYVSDLKTPNANAAIPLAGIYISGGTTSNVFYNSVYLNASSAGALFGSAAIYASTTPTLDMRNNILVNVSTPSGAGVTAAYRRTTTTLTTYSNNSNANCFYSGATEDATHAVYYDGTAPYAMAAYKTLVTPRDANSFRELPPFNSAPTNLHLLSGTPTQCESGGVTIISPISITDDYDGDARLNPPDIGADEGTFSPLDLTPPIITYTPLGNTSFLGNRILATTITDPSGVGSGANAPVLYWKINAGAYTGPVAVKPPQSGDIYNFEFGTGVAAGDVVSYFVVAQDAASTPNVGSYPPGATVTSNPPLASAGPPAPSTYSIVDVPLAGDYTVGNAGFNKITGKNITFQKVVKKVMKEVMVYDPESEKSFEKGVTENIKAEETSSDVMKGKLVLMEVDEISWIPMENGVPYEGPLYAKQSENPQYNFPDGTKGVYLTITAAIADLNLRGVSAAVRFLLTDPTYTTGETYPIVVNIANENLPTATNTVTIRPNTGVTALVQGSSSNSQIFQIRSSYIIIDGSNTGGTDRNLTVENTNTTTPQVIRIASTGTTPIVGVTVKNSTIINGVNTSSAIAIYDIAGTAGYFNDITIQNNSIQKAYNGVYALALVATGNGSGLLYTGNDINTSGANALTGTALYVQGVDGVTVTNNNIANITHASLTASSTGVWFATGTKNGTISGNNISSLSYTGTGAYAPRGIVVTSAVTGANVNVTENDISGISASGTSAPYGIHIFSTTNGVTVQKNKVSNVVNTHTGGYGARGIHVNTAVAASDITLKNNFVWDIKGTSDASTTYWVIGLGIEGATGGVNVYHNSVNLYGSFAGYTSATISAAFAVITSTATNLDIRDNIFVNTYDNTTSATDKSYAINSQAANTAYTFINYNDYYVSGTPGILGYLGGDQTSLELWKTATGKDGNSITGDPGFTTPTDLHIKTNVGVVSNNGFYLVNEDIDEQSRLDPPDIGADEYTYVAPQCPDPLNFDVTNVQYNSATVTWTDALVIDLDYGIIGHTAGTGTIIQNISSGSPYNLNVLQPITGYDIYIRQDCEEVSLLSGWVGPKTITTPDQYSSTIYAVNAVDGTGYVSNVTNTKKGPWMNVSTNSIDTVGRGYVKFDLTSLPSSAIISKVVFNYYNFYKVNSTAANNIFPLSNDPITTAGSALYTDCGDGLSLWSGAWTAATPVWITSQLNSDGNAYFSNQLAAGWAGLGVVRGSTNLYRFTGYNDPTYKPYVTIEYHVPTTPIFSATPASKDFEQVNLGIQSLPQLFTIKNAGVGTLTVSALVLEGADQSQFILTDGNIGNYPIDLGPGVSLPANVSVVFKPTTTGIKTANLKITANAVDYTVNLTGEGYLNGPQNLTASQGVGAFVDLDWEAPLPLTEIRYDNNTAEGWYWVASPSTTSQYYFTRITIPVSGSLTHLSVLSRIGAVPLNWESIRLCPDNAGYPNLAAPVQSWANVPVTSATGQWIIETLSSPLAVAAGDTYYVVTQYPAGSTDGPYIGGDTDSNHGRCYFTTNGGTSWTMSPRNYMMRAYMTVSKESGSSGAIVLTSGKEVEGMQNLLLQSEFDEPQVINGTLIQSYTAPSVLAPENSSKSLTSYTVNRGTTSGVYPTTFTGITGTTYQDITTNPSTLYYYMVSAVYDNGSANSNEVSINTAQIPATLPYSIDFESGMSDWAIVNGTQANAWYLGTATAYEGTKSVYVSNDLGVTNAYTLTSLSVTHFYRDITFPAGPGEVKLNFYWKGQGEGATTFYDYLRVYLVETSVLPVAGTQLTTGQIGATYNLQGTWQFVSLTIDPSNFGTTKRLVFSWRNDASLGTQPPAAVDNISLTYTPSYQVSGTLSYAVPGGTPIDNSSVLLYDYSKALVGTYPTDANGDYSFNAFPGNYNLSASTPKPSGQFNGATTVGDIALAIDHILGTPLIGIQFTAADVDVSTSVDVGDIALMIDNILGSVIPWAAADWLFENPSFAVTASNVTVDFEGLCSGDPDGDYNVPPTCLPPTNVGYNSVTISSVVMTWNTTAASANIKWGPQGFTGAGNPINDVTSPYLLSSGLAPGTAYDFYVQSRCSSTLFSDWVGPITFTTATPQPAGTNCANPFVINSLPFSQTGMTTCGFGDDYNYLTDPGACYYYINGEDFVFEYTPATNVTVTITLTNTLTWTGINVSQGCPDTGTCVGYAGSTTGNPTYSNLSLTGGVTYYIIIGTWPTPDCTPFDIVIQ